MTAVLEPYRYASFLVADHDNARPRIVNDWSLLERVLGVNYRMVADTIEGMPHRVWIWDTGSGQMEPLKRVKVHERTERDGGQFIHTATWQLEKEDGAPVGRLDVTTRAKAKRFNWPAIGKEVQRR